MQEDVERMKQQYEARKMMLTEQRRQEDERQISQKEQDLLKMVQDSQSALAQHEVELTKPLQEKIFTVVQTIAKAENYTYIFDASALIYVDPLKGTDLTNQILDELQKEVK
jgi:Skp family chaperone for outer membrane proteins